MRNKALADAAIPDRFFRLDPATITREMPTELGTPPDAARRAAPDGALVGELCLNSSLHHPQANARGFARFLKRFCPLREGTVNSSLKS
jgi:hypothetical protein